MQALAVAVVVLRNESGSAEKIEVVALQKFESNIYNILHYLAKKD